MTKRKAGTAARTGQPPVEAADGAAVVDQSESLPPAVADVPSAGFAGGSADAGPDAGPDAVTVDGADPHAPDGGFTVPGVAADAGRSHRPGGPLDITITIGGLVVAVLLAVVLAVFEAFLAPLHVSDFGLSGPGKGNMRVPLSLILALVTNPLLGWFAFTTTGRRFAALLPAGAWCVVWILAAGRTTEGDLLITDDNWVGLLTLFTGPLAFAIGIYVSALRHRTAATANSKATPLAPRSVDR